MLNSGENSIPTKRGRKCYLLFILSPEHCFELSKVESLDMVKALLFTVHLVNNYRGRFGLGL